MLDHRYKSDNILVDFGQYGILSRIKLIDLGDSVKATLDNESGSITSWYAGMWQL